jgi:cysteine desulfurase/selenocysteine lyase
MFDINNTRKDFPILSQQVNGKPLVYFDNGATSQKPQAVIDAISKYYEVINANIHRGVHTLSQIATDAYELSREKVRKHINAGHAHEVIFTSGTTGAINLVASAFTTFLKPNDEILV